MSQWAAFRKQWIRPEVYPLIGAMGAAVGVCVTALINKALDPTVTWNKAKRSGEVDLLGSIDEVVPLWSSSKTGSIRIFSSENEIRSNKLQKLDTPEPVTIRIGEEEEEEEEAPAQPESEAPAAPEVVSVAAEVSEVIDEAAETINAAIDAAIETAAAVPAADPTPSPASVAEADAAAPQQQNASEAS